MEYQRRVVCAANMDELGSVILGARHWDELMYKHYRITLSAAGHDRGQAEAGWVGCKQGFIDQHGKFLTREEAWIVAEAAGQIIRRVGGDMSSDNIGSLYSENLY